MYVRVNGLDHDGQAVFRTWSLVAEAGDGAYVPILPATILVRKLADHSLRRCGAIPCLGLFSLQEFRKEIDGLNIKVRDE
ncbi:MAG: hypothetical protein IH953_06505 [Chloroflexi bacterium]|nr:hypothetical protein [Chloroflexota bacterium]